MRLHVVLLTALLLLATACSATGAVADGVDPAPAVASRGVLLDRVRTLVAEVAEAQSSADPPLAEALAGVREVDAIVSRLRDPETVDAAKDRMPRVDAAFVGVDPEAGRTGFRELAFAVDRARAALAAATEGAPEGEDTYLVAQDAALVAMRDYAAAADALTQVLADRWPLYASIRDSTATFVEERWLYRSSEEAAQAFEVELSDRLDGLAAAQDDIRVFRQRRDGAADRVNETSRAAAAVWADLRAGEAASGTGTG